MTQSDTQATSSGSPADRLRATLALGLDRVPLQVWTARPDGSLDFVNLAVAEYFGRPAHELLDDGWVEMVHPSDVPACLHAWSESLASGEPYEIQFRLLGADGAYRWHLGRATPERTSDSLISGWVGTNTDIDAQKRSDEVRLRRLLREQAAREAEQALRSRAEADRDRLQQVLDVLPEGVAIVDRAGLFVLSNAAARRIWGRTPPAGTDVHTYQSVFNISRSDGEPHVPEDVPIARAFLHGEVVTGEQMLVRNALTGAMLPLLVNCAPLTDAFGARVGAVSIFQDISALKALDRQKDEFLASASHDLKNPLGTIKGTAQLLKRCLERTGNVDPARLTSGLTNIDLTVTHMAAQLEQLLEVARVRMGQKTVLEPQPMDLVALARDCVEMAQTATEQHALRVEADAPLTGVWDRDRLRRMLTNLLSNAIKYSPAGGEILVHVARDADATGQFAVLTVHDSGIGIPAEDLPYVFERFRRASNVTGTFEGTGIGLADVEEIVHQHAGSVAVDSRPSAGTTFVIRLPLPGAGST